MNVVNPLSGFLLGVSLAAPLGPAGVAVIQTGLLSGFRRAWLTSLGITTADLVYMSLALFGLAGFLQIPLVKSGLLLVGALVLLYFGVSSLLEARKGLKISIEKPLTRRPPYLVGFLVNISNPLAIVWWLSVFGTIVGESAAQAYWRMGLQSGLSIILGILSWHSLASFLSARGQQFFRPALLKVISILAGLVLLGFGLRFGWQAVQVWLR